MGQNHPRSENQNVRPAIALRHARLRWQTDIHGGVAADAV